MANVAVTEHTPEILVKKLDDIDSALKTSKEETLKEFNALKESAADRKSLDDLSTSVAQRFADALQKQQDFAAALNDVKRQLDSPLYGTDKQVDDAERKAAIDHERILFNAINKNINVVFDEKTVDLARYRALKTANRKTIVAQSQSEFHDIWANRLTEDERKSLSMSQIDGNYFIPEIQQVIRDCFLEPVGLGDLYDAFSVGRMSFMYPFIKDHTMLGGYICSDQCGTIEAAGINLQFREDRVYDWRGTFCVTTRVITDSAIDIMALMAREMALSKRMTSNKAWIAGDGVNQPKGWLSSNLFPVVPTSTASGFTAADVRGFFYRVPPEYGNITAVMHPNTLAVIMTMTDAIGRFLFVGDQLFPDLETLADRIRLTRYMPEIQWTVTPGGAGEATTISAPAGSLVAAAANWRKAYMVPTLLPMMMRPGFLPTGPWCSQYHFWAQDGGAGVCGEAGRVLQVS